MSMNKLNIPAIYNWNLSRQIILSCVVMVILFVAVYVYLLEIKVDAYVKNTYTEQQLKDEYTNKYAIYKNLPEYDLQNKQLLELNKRLMSKFPNEIEMGTLIFEINQLAKNNFIKLNTFQPQDAKQDRVGLMLLLIKVNLNGEYTNFIDFMVDLTTLSQIINITDFNVTRNNDANITVGFNLNIHFNKQ